ncbi:fasciclin domain-containing protein [Actinoplanes utahensis]|uniref:FAS1 domain-containing protein n=1 Tax=Actinoplanes utahensis TaxID=1869 RepID=A0A0A6URA8_ACTUT|nr:fasciclin domain-containing protein [Actinoplanes utahensis]KHD77568.1 hypothetical protein MB27_10815 [Actinoplanes utahensis]GIF32752.1 hypothetical protein Aut01nite_57380 [Actinoplanes utahensis]
MKRASLAVVLTVTLSGCGFQGPGGTVTAQPLPSGSTPADACAPHNLAAMAGKPVTAAIAANPGLSGMVAGLDRAGLGTLDEAPALTLFATSDRFLAVFPFQRIPPLWDDPAELAQLLKQAAVPQRLEPDRLPGTHTTMGGTQAVVTTDAGRLRVNDTRVACQQLDTTNAAIYIVDQMVPQR